MKQKLSTRDRFLAMKASLFACIRIPRSKRYADCRRQKKASINGGLTNTRDSLLVPAETDLSASGPNLSRGTGKLRTASTADQLVPVSPVEKQNASGFLSQAAMKSK
jgi:hypothetical protein